MALTAPVSLPGPPALADFDEPQRSTFVMLGVLTIAVRTYHDRWGYGVYSGPIGTAVLMIAVKWVRTVCSGHGDHVASDPPLTLTASLLLLPSQAGRLDTGICENTYKWPPVLLSSSWQSSLVLGKAESPSRSASPTRWVQRHIDNAFKLLPLT